MISAKAQLMKLIMRFTLKRKSLDTVEKIRDMVADIQTKPHPKVTIESLTVKNMEVDWHFPPEANKKSVILYLHGGGYVSGGSANYRGLASQIAYASRIPVVFPNYRLAPENPYPAALDDAVEMYKWLMSAGYNPKNIIIAGDSAGGGLTLATMLKIRDLGMTLPAAAICLSPWTDLHVTGDSMDTKAKRDPWLKPIDFEVPADAYGKPSLRSNPYVSPLYGDLEGLPPIFIHVGESEILLDDSVRFAEKARAAGVDVTLKVWDGMWHVFPIFADMVPEGQQCIREMAVFANASVPTTHATRMAMSFPTKHDLSLVS